jgi:signal transduction histidine kinase
MLKDGTYGEIPSSIAEPIASLAHSASQMRDLVNDLLDISRVDSGRLVAQPRSIKILDLAKDVALGMTRQLQSKSLKLLMFPRHLDLELETDPKLAGEMLRNLLDNAIKYSNKFGRVWIEIDKVSGGIKLSVKDEGLGIPTDQQHRMFEKFFRATNAMKQDVDGTGLGLYYVKKCAQALEARLGFQSAENKGSTFWFVLPLK